MGGNGRPSAGDPRANRPRWHSEHLGDLRVFEAAQVAKHHRSSELRAHRLEGVVDGDAVGDLVRDAARSSLVDRQVIHRDWTAGPTPQLVEAGVHRDSVRPGAERGSTIELGQAADDGEKRLLGRVKRVGIVPGETAAHAMKTVEVTPQQHVECVPIALPRRVDERDLVESADGANATWP
jgi:hypothetical protein